MLTRTLLLAALLLPITPLEAQELATTSPAREIDDFLKSTYPPDQPGAAVIVVKDGEVMFREAYGMANIELGVPLEPDMVFRLGSITKQFTAAAVLLLEERGKLSIDDPITNYLEDYPTHGHEITIAHLLAHTSGIKSYTDVPGWMISKIKKYFSLEKLIDEFKDLPMDFAPGEEFRYNNSGYVLLGAVIESASGKDYDEFIEEEIFKPLGMTSSCYGDHGRIIPRRTPGYDGRPDKPRNAQYLSMSQPHAAGSLLSTVDDLAKWDAALYSDVLLSAESRAKQVVPFQLNNGESTNYAYGFMIGNLRDRPTVEHGGGIFGFSTFGLRLPKERLYVAVLTNSFGRPTAPSLVARTIAAIAIGDPFPERRKIELEEAALEQLVGEYRINDSETRKVTLRRGKLYTQRTGSGRREIQPASESLFFYDGSLTYLTFERDEAGKVTHMLVYPDGSGPPERADLQPE